VSTQDRVAIIGSGLGGLAAACTLAARGYAVTVFEKSPWLGGKAAQLNESGFRFDMGPTILTIPRILRRIFTEAGRNIDDYLTLIKLDPQWRCFFTDNSVLDLVEHVDTMAERLKTYSSANTSAGYQEFMQLSSRLNRVSETHYFWKSIGGIRDMIDFMRGLRR
jgi:diapolycopene oxygenase